MEQNQDISVSRDKCKNLTKLDFSKILTKIETFNVNFDENRDFDSIFKNKMMTKIEILMYSQNFDYM